MRDRGTRNHATLARHIHGLLDGLLKEAHLVANGRDELVARERIARVFGHLLVLLRAVFLQSDTLGVPVDKIPRLPRSSVRRPVRFVPRGKSSQMFQDDLVRRVAVRRTHLLVQLRQILAHQFQFVLSTGKTSFGFACQRRHRLHVLPENSYRVIRLGLLRFKIEDLLFEFLHPVAKEISLLGLSLEHAILPPRLVQLAV